MAELAEVRRVLANWISLAYSPETHLVDGVTPAEWVADNFLKWWHTEVLESLTDAGAAVSSAQALAAAQERSDLTFDEIIHELTHADEALADLQNTLGFLK